MIIFQGDLTIFQDPIPEYVGHDPPSPMAQLQIMGPCNFF